VGCDATHDTPRQRNKVGVGVGLERCIVFAASLQLDVETMDPRYTTTKQQHRTQQRQLIICWSESAMPCSAFRSGG
jgi:hypothetical protein